MIKAFIKHKQLYAFAEETTQFEALKKRLGNEAELCDCGKRQNFENNSGLHRWPSSN